MRTPLKAKKLALFASGAGSNVRNIYAWFKDRPDVEIALLVCNRPEAPVVTFAKEVGIPVRLVDKATWVAPEMLVEEIRKAGVDYIVLAGFLWLIPDALINAYPDKIINLHPALLPKYGGKGMYGKRVHEAVIQSGETESGISVHYVNGRYDEGAILFQAQCSVTPEDTADTLAQKIHQLEHQWLPVIIDKLLLLT